MLNALLFVLFVLAIFGAMLLCTDTFLSLYFGEECYIAQLWRKFRLRK